jgi:hypothetical protein
VSQPGITRAEMAKYLAAHGWRKLPRKPGRRLAWESPNSLQTWPTDMAYEIAVQCNPKTGRGR